MTWKLTNLLLLTLWGVSTAQLCSQNVILEQTVPDSSQTRSFGHNRRHSAMGMVGVGSIFGADGDIAIKSGLSNYYQLGALYKLKINGLLSVVAELGYRRESYLRGNLSAISNDSLEISSARYNLNIAQPNLGLRFNFDPKRGNVLGTYLEIGGGPSLLLWASSYTRTKVYQLRHTNEEYAQTQATRVSPLRGFNAIQWVGYARLGRGRFAVVGMYRLTPAVNKAKQPGLVLPEVSAGLQLAL